MAEVKKKVDDSVTAWQDRRTCLNCFFNQGPYLRPKVRSDHWPPEL